MADVQILPSTHSLESDQHTTRLGPNATLVCPGEAYSNYDFIAVLGLAQQLKINLLPITWQDSLGLIGQSRAQINQALVDIQTSFAFKRFDHTMSDPFQETVQEMAILGHPFVRDHPHFVQLIGICWDFPQDDQVWPVLVFEKSNLGNLGHFARLGKCKKLSLEDRLKICIDVGVAIRDMHQNNIIHGDIKPQNVLMFEKRSGIYTAKVCDFGFSTHFQSKQDLIRMPKSEPWNAPEHHSRYFHPQAAKAMDVYSFGMLCLWFLFGSTESATLSLSLEARDIRHHIDLEDVSQSWVVESWKSERDYRMLEWAFHLLKNAVCLGKSQRDRLSDFFRSTLNFDSAKRDTDFTRLLGFLSPTQIYPMSAGCFNIQPVSVKKHFQIQNSLESLYRADFRLRCFITNELKAVVAKAIDPMLNEPQVRNVGSQDESVQLALCSKIGFGVGKDKKVTERIVLKAQVSELQIANILLSIRCSGDGPEPHSKIYRDLLDKGVIKSIDYSAYYHPKELLDKAERHYAQEYQEFKELFGEKHRICFILNHIQARIKWGRGEWSTAEEIYSPLVEVQANMLGKDHPETLTSMSNLALLLQHQGKYEQAVEMNWQVLSRREKVLGREYPSTVTSLNNLALVLQLQGKYTEAEEMHIEALDRSNKALGRDHPDTLRSMNNVADVFWAQGKYEQAEEMHLQALEGRENILGEDHPETIQSVSNLAIVLWHEGKYDQAEEKDRLALKRREKVLGKDHPDTLTSMNNLAVVLNSLGKYAQAEEMHWRVLEGRKNALGKEHPLTLTSMTNLALLFHAQGRYEIAQEMTGQALKGHKNMFGEEYMAMSVVAGNLARLLRYQGSYEQAEKMCRRALEGANVMGEAYHTLTVMNNLALVLQNQGKYKQAEEMHWQVMRGYEELLGKQHLSTLTSMNNLADVLQAQRRYQQAEEINWQVLRSLNEMVGKEHPSTLTCLNNLAFVLQAQGKYEKAEKLTRRALEGRKKVLGEENLDTLTTLNNLALVLRSQGRYEQAEEMLWRVLEGRENALGEEHPDTLTSMNNLAVLLVDQGRHEAAEEMDRRARRSGRLS